MTRSLSVCPSCGGKVARNRTTYPANVRQRVVPIEGDFLKCQQCGEFYFGSHEIDDVLKRANTVIRQDEGLLQPQEILALRKRLGLTQKQFEELLGVGPKTVVRWEKGTVFQNKATDNLIRLAMALPDALAMLASKSGIAMPPALAAGPRNEVRMRVGSTGGVASRASQQIFRTNGDVVRAKGEPADTGMERAA